MNLEVLPGTTVDGPTTRWAGAVLCRDVLDDSGHPVLTKGTMLGPEHEDVLRTAHPR